ncbi:MAG TPA: hypothetical protein VKB81_17650 [Nitrospira sp.]|nr:hypothetical protein [Nitrospira sp.]
MKRMMLVAGGLTLTVGMLSGCSGSDSPPVMSSGSTSAATADDQRTPESDALTQAEVAQVNQANAEPVRQKQPDL